MSENFSARPCVLISYQLSSKHIYVHTHTHTHTHTHIYIYIYIYIYVTVATRVMQSSYNSLSTSVSDCVKRKQKEVDTYSLTLLWGC